VPKHIPKGKFTVVADSGRITGPLKGHTSPYPVLMWLITPSLGRPPKNLHLGFQYLPNVVFLV